ncbi:SDR family NAD(P)-dependent oxidoreductase [Paractinoplanes hotanensis]|uniref:SDR family NAD(P)-dependent oxidoreductase n=1 Tax=Paractinoplanes hotanensis TaxID=2906497 RepID=A0ABT0Y9U9_9ACTN|nr:SDR family NAD(P)-dependent oxidoreductase [Actinoplanes hotanensis]MCM4082278.1 SDR family NAD(P)-dependent oxidoreductase [Actinoplanes hotanensis]
MSKTVVVFGAGTGLGSAVARRFGREGYRVALVARNRERLDRLAAVLSAEGIEAEGFPADLTRTADVPELIARIRDRFGRIDVIEYAPITTEGFTPAAELDAAGMRRHLDLFLLTPIEIVRAVLPELLERGDGAILLGQGVSATHPMPGLSGLGPAMAAARNYLQSLHSEVEDRGVYVGAVHVAAMVLGSAGHTAMTDGELASGIDVSQIPQIDPADIAEALWDIYAKRDRFEVQVPEFG